MHSTETLRAHIQDLEQRRYRAMLDGNIDAFIELSHPGLTYTHSNGVVDTLSSYVAKCRDGYYHYLHLDYPIDNIQVIGEIAVVHGRMSGRIVSGGTEKTIDNRTLSLWSTLGGEWKFLAYQPTPIK